MVSPADTMSEMTFDEKVEAVRREHDLPEFTLETMDLWRLLERHDDVREVIDYFCGYAPSLSESQTPQIPVGWTFGG